MVDDFRVAVGELRTLVVETPFAIVPCVDITLHTSGATSEHCEGLFKVWQSLCFGQKVDSL